MRDSRATFDFPGSCPHCGSAVSQGFLGPARWLVWFDTPGRVWTFFQMLYGRQLVRGVMRKVPAWRCRRCGLVMFLGEGDEPSHASDG